MNTTISPLNPGLARDLMVVVARANKRCYANSGQTGTLSTVAALQMLHAATGQTWGVTAAQVMSLTGLSQSTVRGHLKFWYQKGVLKAVGTPMGDTAYIINLGD
jgi:hypothetical protein